MNVLVFDPGVTTGYAIFVQGEKAHYLKEAGHCHSLEATAELIHSFADRYEGRRYIVYEGFARGNSVVKDQLITIEMCGAIRGCANVFSISTTSQYPASRTGYVPVAKCMVKELFSGTYQQYHHAIDAIAHGLCFLDKEEIEWQKQYWLRKAFPSVD